MNGLEIKNNQSFFTAVKNSQRVGRLKSQTWPILLDQQALDGESKSLWIKIVDVHDSDVEVAVRHQWSTFSMDSIGHTVFGMNTALYWQ